MATATLSREVPMIETDTPNTLYFVAIRKDEQPIDCCGEHDGHPCTMSALAWVSGSKFARRQAMCLAHTHLANMEWCLHL